MTKLLDIYIEVLIIILCLNRFTFAAFCSEYYTCSSTCYRVRQSYNDGCFGWLGWSRCSRYETAAYACTKMCQRRFCCEGSAGENCEQVEGSRYVRIVAVFTNSTSTYSTATNSTASGTLQVYEHDNWINVCAIGWNDVNTDIACRTIGYKSGIQLDNLEYSGTNVTQWTLTCQGNETDLSRCTKNEDLRIGNDTCTGAVTISCQTVCRSGYFGRNCTRCNCNSKYTKSCDAETGQCYCKDGWTNDNCSVDLNECDMDSNVCPDEMICTNTIGSYNCVCKIGYLKVHDTCQEINGSYVRLSEKKVSKQAVEGRLQVYHDNEWNSVCPFNWDILNTHISCRSLGYMSGIIWGSSEVATRTGMVRCTGNETDIGLCVFLDDNKDTIGCSKAVNLFCSGVCREGFYGENCSECSCTNTTKLHCNKEFGTCSCKGNGSTICETDLDECKQYPGTCANNMNCINIPGSYECHCKDGFVEDHGTCKGVGNTSVTSVGALVGTSVITVLVLSVCVYFCMKKKKACRTTSIQSSISHVEIVADTQPDTVNDQYDTIGELNDNCSSNGGYAEIGSVIGDIVDSSRLNTAAINRAEKEVFSKNTHAYLQRILNCCADEHHEIHVQCCNHELEVSGEYVFGRVAENSAVESDMREAERL